MGGPNTALLAESICDWWSLAGVDALVGAIVAFRMRIRRIDAKFKLSQNRSRDDRVRVPTTMSSKYRMPPCPMSADITGSCRNNPPWQA